MKRFIFVLSFILVLFKLSSCSAIFGTSSIYAVLSTQISKTSPYVLHELNTGLRMEVEQVTFPKSVSDLISNISDGQVIVYGPVSAVNTSSDVYKFKARQVYLSLPPISTPSPVIGYNQYFKGKSLSIVCVRFPCNNIRVDQLNGENTYSVAEVNLKTLDVPTNLFDDYISAIILNGSAIALGEIDQNGEVLSLEVHDVFIKVPFSRKCSTPKPTACKSNQVAAYKLTPELCVVPSDTPCVTSHPCPQIKPYCPPQYYTFSFVDDSGCSKFYCFPNFIKLE